MSPPEADRRARLGRYVSAAIGVVFAVLGLLVDLYTEQARNFVDTGWLQAVVRVGALVALFVLACVVTWLYADRSARAGSQKLITSASFDIRNQDFADDLPSEAAVVGRKLRYLERPTASPHLVVFLPGLGLDGGDFRHFMAVATEHTVAITLFGLNLKEARNDRYGPIDLTTQAQLVSGLLKHLQRRHPRKQLVLVGFSVGADMIIRLSELWHERPTGAPKVRAALLLDPNINLSTMNISSAVAKMDTAAPLAELKRLVQQAETLTEFQNVCEYLFKITQKNLNQVRQQARDIVAYCGANATSDQFLGRVQNLLGRVTQLKIIFSVHYEQQFNEMVANARAKGLSPTLFDVVGLDHFQLLDDDVVLEEVAKLIRAKTRSVD